MFSEEDRQRNLRSFQHKARLLLTDMERDYLHDVLKQYQTYKDVERMMNCLQSALDTPAKLDLLREIRGLIPPGHIQLFDQMAPYRKMAHPFSPPDGVWKRMPSWHGKSSRSQVDWNVSNLYPDSPDNSRVATVTVDGEDLGFTIKGGAEQKMGIFITRVEPNSDAEYNGLLAGDQILEVNNISFEVIPIHTASTVLRGNSRLRIKVHTPVKSSVHDKKRGSDWFKNPSERKGVRQEKERTVLIQLDELHRYIGFNIRGGSEYGLGIFVSRIDPGGLAELNGIKPGDQILEVNGQKFDKITHAEAVDMIRQQKHMIMRIRSTNKVPTYPRIEDNLPPRSQSALPSKTKSSPPSSLEGSIKSMPVHVPNKDWLIRTDHSDKVPKESQEVKEVKRPSSSASSHSSKPSSKQGSAQPSVQGSVRSKSGLSLNVDAEAGRDAKSQRKPSEPHPVPSGPSTTDRQEGSSPRRRRGKKMLGRSMSMKVTGEKRRQRAEPEHFISPEQEKKKGKSFRQIFFGTRNKKEKQSIDKMENESEADRSRSEVRNQEEKVQKEPVQREMVQRDLSYDESFDSSTDERRGRKGGNRMRGLISSFRKTRDEIKVKKRPALRREESVDQDEPHALAASGSWATRKDASGLNTTDEKSMDMSSYQSIGKSRGMFMQGAGTQVMLSHIVSAPNYALLEEAARRVLNEDEHQAVMRHIKRYQEQRNIQGLVSPLLAILDKPEKILLFREVRGMISPEDIVTFDNLVSKTELKALKQVQKEQKENQRLKQELESINNTNKNGSEGERVTLYSHVPPFTQNDPLPVMSVSEDHTQHIPIGDVHYMNVYTNEDGNLSKMKEKKVLISSNPEIIPGTEINPESSSLVASPRHSTPLKTFGLTGRIVTTNDTDMNKNDINMVPQISVCEEDIVHNRYNQDEVEFPPPPPPAVLESYSNGYHEKGWYPSVADTAAVGSYTVNAEPTDSQVTVSSEKRNQRSSPHQRPSLPPPPPPLLTTQTSVSSLPPMNSSPSSHQGQKGEPIYAKVNKLKKSSNSAPPPQQPIARQTSLNPPDYATIADFDRLSVNSGSSEGSSKKVGFSDYKGSPKAPRRGILKNSFNNDFSRPNIQVRNPDVGGDDYEPSPLRQLSIEARLDMDLQLEDSGVSFGCMSARGDPFSIDLLKNNPFLGISVSGGKDCKHQPCVKVDEIFPGGAAEEDGTLKVGYIVVGVDGESLRNVSHEQAVEIIRRVYNDRSKPFMRIEFLPS